MKAIPLLRGRVLLVDDADFKRVRALKWFAFPGERNIYAYARIRHDDGVHRISAHRFIMDAQPGQVIDHVNGLGLDCRRENMRFCTTAENARNSRHRRNNSSGFRGVIFDKARGLFRAQIVVGYVCKNLGRFATAEEAARARDAAAIRLHGAFARTNRSLGLLPA